MANALTASTGLQFVLGTDYDGSSARALKVLYGTTSTTACIGNDSRLSDSRPASSIDTTTNGFVQTINSNGTLLIRNLQSADIPNNVAEAGSVVNSLLTANGLLSSGAYNGSTPRTISVDFGNSFSTLATQAVKCSDTRLSDTRNTTNSLSEGDGITAFTFNGSSTQTVAVDSSVIRTTGNQSMSGTKTFSEKVNIQSSATNDNSLLTLEKTGNYESKMNFISGSMPPSGEISIGIDQATTGRGLCMSNYDGGVFSFGYINSIPNHYTINLDTTSNVTIKPIKAGGVTDCNHTTQDYKLIDFKASSSSNSGLRINTTDSFIALGEDINHTAPADEILRINTDQTVDMYTHFENVGSGGALYHASRNAEADTASFGVDQDGDVILARNGTTFMMYDKSNGSVNITGPTVDVNTAEFTITEADNAFDIHQIIENTSTAGSRTIYKNNSGNGRIDFGLNSSDQMFLNYTKGGSGVKNIYDVDYVSSKSVLDVQADKVMIPNLYGSLSLPSTTANRFKKLITPRDLMSDNDSTSQRVTVWDTDVTNPSTTLRRTGLGAETASSAPEIYCYIEVPYGCKVISIKMIVLTQTTAVNENLTQRHYAYYPSSDTPFTQLTSSTTNTEHTFSTADQLQLTQQTSDPVVFVLNMNNSITASYKGGIVTFEYI